MIRGKDSAADSPLNTAGADSVVMPARRMLVHPGVSSARVSV